MSKSRTTTDPNWLHNAHAGEILASEFMEPLGLDAASLGQAIGARLQDLEAVIASEHPMDAKLKSPPRSLFPDVRGLLPRLAG